MERFKAIAAAQKIIENARREVVAEFGVDNPAWAVLHHAGQHLIKAYGDIRNVDMAAADAVS